MPMSTSLPVAHQPQYEDLFRYTGGRWLFDEDQRLKERYRPFNVDALRSVAAESVSSKCCVSLAKLGEGRYNKVFKLVMDDGKTVIARIPNLNAGPAFYSIASEAATMDFVCNFSQLLGFRGEAQDQC